jgi:hypothetical protein
LEQVEPVEVTVCCDLRCSLETSNGWNRLRYDGLGEFAELDVELKRILQIAIPLTFGTISNDLFHLVPIAFIANFISTDSMVVLTNEVVGTVSDADSTPCWFLAGQGLCIV